MPAEKKSKSILDPIDRNAEILFGVFMCLTFTGTLSVTTAGSEEIRTMMIAAIACNTAWGLVDAVMYVMRTLVGRGRSLQLVRAVRSASNTANAHAVIAADLRPIYLRAIENEGLEKIRAELLAVREVPAFPALTRADIRAAFLIFALVFLSTFPLVLPFMFFDHLPRAMRVSAAIAIVIVFLCGYSWGKHIGARPIQTGLVMVTVGVLLEAVIIALGG
jgi:hypothetical protein